MNVSAPSPLIPAYLTAAALAVDLVADPAVGASWRRPSALVGFDVAGLAGHLASQVFSVEQTLAAPVRDGAVANVLEHYAQVAWVGAAPEDEISVSIRAGADLLSSEGVDTLVARARSSRDRIAQTLPARSLDDLVQPAWLSWSLQLRDFLTTRLTEIAVHCDDLAVSVDVPTPTFPPEVIDPVFGLLTSLAARRHGQPAVLRALSRAERAPAAINAI
jgi:hypothetical protein